MGRRWRYFGGCVGGVCLLVLAGCAPTRHWTKDDSRPKSSPSSKSEIKTAKENTVNPTQGSETTKQPMPLNQPMPDPTVFRLAGDDPLLTERIALYQQQKTEWETTGKALSALGTDNALPESWNECLQDIELTLDGYQRLQRGEDNPNLWNFLGRDLHYFSRDCNQVLASAQAKLSGTQVLPVTPVTDATLIQMQQFFEAAQYQEVITSWEAMPKGEDGSLPGSRELKVICSRSLIKLGRLQEAADMLTKLMDDVSQPMDLTSLEIRILTGDVLLAIGQVEAARQVYEGVAVTLAPIVSQQEWISTNIQTFSEQINPEELTAYREQLQAYLLFDGKQVPATLSTEGTQSPGQSKSSFIELRKILLAKATEQSQVWARKQLTEIRSLLASHNLERARELLQELSAAAPTTMSSAITQLDSEITQAELAAQETPPSTEEKPPISPWDEALHLFEQQRYDEAIAVFQTLLDSEHGSEANAKIAEASELAASAMRRQAAALYAKAKKTFAPEAKRQGLLNSRTLLMEIIERYPHSSVVDKARQNLKVLDLELGLPPPPS